MIRRRSSRVVRIGGVEVGGAGRVVVQSMTKTDTRDIAATVNQIRQLQECGCEIVRVAVPDMEAARAIVDIKKKSKIPVIADIHFDYRLALAALESGVDGLRLNPGNISDRDQIATVVRAAKEREVPIRVGVNAGSLPPAKPVRGELRRTMNGPSRQGVARPVGTGSGRKENIRPSIPSSTVVERMVEAALVEVRLLESLDFDLIKVSVKAFDVPATIEAYRAIAPKIPYPLHLGITEAGLPWSGAIRSAVGLGVLLYEGIGDTIRVSLTTADACREVECAYEILKSLKLREHGPVLVSCPSCGRAETDIVRLAGDVEERLKGMEKAVKVAVMGCVVNGPGEARDADVGIACGRGKGVIFKKGRKVRTVDEADFLGALMAEVGAL